jgi:hypothetical protein
MYSVNGTALDNPTFGWRLLRPTKPLLDLVAERANVSPAVQDGTVEGLPGSFTAPVLTFVVLTPRAGLETLMALWMQGSGITYTGVPGKVIGYEFLSFGNTIHGPAIENVELEVTVRIPRVFWRAAADATTAPVNLDAATVNLTGLFPGIGGTVADAIVRIKGATTGIQVTDSAGSWFTYPPALAAGSYLRFESDTGRAYVTTTNTWTGGTEVSGDVDYGGPRGIFEITPYLSPANPSIRDGRLTVTTATRTSATVEVRGRAAFML